METSESRPLLAEMPIKILGYVEVINIVSNIVYVRVKLERIR